MPLDNTPESNEAQYANHIPAAVRRAAERAEEISRAAYPTEAAPAAEPAAEPVSTTVVSEPVAPTVVAPEDFEQKYKTLKGKYDAEIPQLRSDATLLRNQVASLERIVAAQREEPQPAAPAAPAATPVVTPEDVEQYGEELIAKVRAWARAEVEPQLAELNTLKSNFAQVQQTQTQTVQFTAHQSVMATLDADPTVGRTWRQTNDSPEFINWLQSADPFSGQVRHNLLREAFDAGNAARTMAFFKTYHAEHTAINEIPAAAPVHTAGTPATDRPRLEDFVAPGRATGQAPAGAHAEKRIWSPREIETFYRNVQRGMYHGKEAEQLRIEQDIIAATAEGRFKP